MTITFPKYRVSHFCSARETRLQANHFGEGNILDLSKDSKLYGQLPIESVKAGLRLLRAYHRATPITAKNPLTLDLSNTAISGGHLHYLRDIPVKTLNLSQTYITDAAINEQLPSFNLEHLEELDLSHTRITHAGLRHLGRILKNAKNLKTLNLSNCRGLYTPAVNMLKQALATQDVKIITR